MSTLNDIVSIVQGAGLSIVSGYAGTQTKLPYTVVRPLLLGDPQVAVAGNGLAWDEQHTLYACGESVEASFNLAVLLMKTLDGARVGGTTLSTTMGYSGAQVEGHYESQVTVQLNRGAL